MILYLLKSIACLLILLAIHRVILQREAIYKFNRFFLLAAVLGSFLIPLVEIEVVQKGIETPDEVISNKLSQGPIFEIQTYPEFQQEITTEPVKAEKPRDWNLILQVSYGLITLVFLIRFIRNIKVLIDKINRNIHVQFRGETLVLLKEQSLPFSFLSYIFVSRDYFEKGQLTDSIFVHEQAHIQGKHSWDNLLIEGLLVIFWFNPGLYLARQAIKLNHEFIADAAALQITPLEQYKTFLLAMMLPDQNPGMVSSLNFSLTKKRFEMMKRNTKNSTRWMLLLILVPLIGALVYIFGEKVALHPEKKEVVEAPTEVVGSRVEEVEIDIKLLTEREIEVNGQVIYFEQLAQLLEETKKDNALVRFSVNPRLKMEVAADVQEILREQELRKVVFKEWGKEFGNWDKESERYYQNAYILIEDENMVYSHKTYQQLNEKEKKGLFGPMTPPSKKTPHPTTFEEWKNKENYAIWLDQKVISNEELTKMQPSDIVMFWSSRVMENARSARFPQPFQLHLYTEEYYEKELGPNSDRLDPLTNQDTITITQRMVTWNKDISRYPDPNTAYLQKYVRYENLRTSGAIYTLKGQEEKDLLDKLYQELESEYSSSNDKRKKISSNLFLQIPMQGEMEIPHRTLPKKWWRKL